MTLILLSILIPAVCGILLPILRLKDRRIQNIFVIAALAAELLSVVLLCLQKDASCTMFAMTSLLSVKLRLDAVSRLFLIVSSAGYLLAGIFAVRYLDHEEKEGSLSERTFWCFYLTSLAALVGMALSANLIAMYFFFEMATLLSMPLVLFERTKESVAAALKYLFYSIAGAFLGLGCIFVLSHFCTSLDFAAGGVLDMAAVSGHEGLILTMTFVGVIGFGAKAGLYPLHGWLPTAHPEAPAPASAVLSGVITQAGVLAILRLIYFTVGRDFLYGTWVQTALLVLALLTVFMGSMMAYREKLLKKRLAYSSVSQISYVLFGLFLMTGEGYLGALMQVLFHATAKIGLFLCAGSVIYNTGLHRVDELKAYGKAMPKTFGAFTLLSLSLIGIPPFAGFVSKWYLAEGALASGLGAFTWVGPLILIISALLTAGYLLPLSVAGFFPGKDASIPKKNDEGGLYMLLPLFVLATLALLLGLAGGLLSGFFADMTAGLF